MAELHRQLVAGADFEEMAERESESQSRVRGGSLGFLAPDELPPPVAAALADLGPGELTEPVEHGDGVSLFLCEEVRAATVPSAAEVRDKLRANLRRQRARERWSALQADLLQRAAPRLRPGSGDTVLDMDGYQLDRTALVALVPFRLPGRTLADLDEAEVERLLKMWATGVVCARNAVELGLDQEPAIAAALRWGEVATLAHLELVHRVDQRLEEPDDEAVLRYYQDHRERYRQLASYRLAAIHLGTGETREQVEQARAVARQLDSGALSFDAAARAHSVDPSAADGGRLGWLGLRQLAGYGPIASRAVRQLRPGQRTGLLHLESGLWIFELRGVRDTRPQTFDEARPQARAGLRRLRIRELEQVIRTEQLQSLDLEIPERTPVPAQPTGAADGGAASGRG
jgi:parvulin-like peptidyl-prolyl isomerase